MRHTRPTTRRDPDTGETIYRGKHYDDEAELAQAQDDHDEAMDRRAEQRADDARDNPAT